MKHFLFVPLFAVILCATSTRGAGPARVDWGSSRIQGTPGKPLAFVAKRVFPKLKFNRGLEMVAAGGRLFVAEQAGKIFSFANQNETAKTDLFIDLKAADAQALNAYGLVFHPKWRANGQVFITYTVGGDEANGTKVVCFNLKKTKPGGAPALDPESGRVILRWRRGGHNGGCLKFGPDGMLYIATGDASAPSPPDGLNTGQDNSDLLSSILRIDVNGEPAAKGKPYRVPPDNPFVGKKNVRPEIWSFGFRQPWKMSFDARGRLWVGEVGWELWETIHLVTRGSNHGWSAVESTQPIKPGTASALSPITAPVASHPHSEAASMTGGFVYGGKLLPALRGAYVYGDYETGKIWALWHDGRKVTRHEEIADTPHRIVSFGLDENGELFYLHYNEAGSLHRLVPNPRAAQPNTFPRQLSGTGLFADTAAQKAAPGVYEYRIAEPMWQDGAIARRFIALPGNSKIQTDATRNGAGRITGATVKWPADAVLARTVSLPGAKPKPVETQMLHFDGEQWQGYSYHWNEAGTDAELVGAPGAEVEVPARGWKGGARFRIHSRAECGRCHNSWSEYSLSFQPLQLTAFVGFKNQPARETALALGLTDADFFDRNEHGRLATSRAGGSLDKRARSWLHANCAHCHRRHGGGAAPLEVNFDRSLSDAALLHVKPTRGDFGIRDARIIVPGEPLRSVLPYRVAAIGSGHMPLIGAREVDEKGLRLLWDWIAALPHVPPPVPVAGTDIPALIRDNPPGIFLKDANGAMTIIHALDTQKFSPADRQRAIAAGLDAPNANVSALFERFRPPGERPATLGANVDSAKLLSLPGDIGRGKKILAPTGKWAACYACHTINKNGNPLGPDLSQVGARLDNRQILESLLEPSKTIAPEYRAWLVTTTDGKQHTGFIAKITADQLTLKLATGQLLALPKARVKNRQALPLSLMPRGLLQSLTPQEAADVLAWMRSLK